MANGFNVPPVNLNMYTPTGSQMQLSPVRNVLGSQQPMPYSSAGISSILQGIQQRTPQREAFAGVPFPRPTMLPQQGVPVPQPRPTDMPLSPPSGLDQLRAAQLRMPARNTPQGAGLSAASQQLLAASGYTDKPLSMGQILGSAGAAYTEAEQAARDRAEEKRRQDLADQLALSKFQLDVQTAMKPKDPTKPQVETFYDMSTGLPYKAQWNPSTQNWDKVGGVKVSDFEQTTIDPETGLVTITKGTGEAPTALEPTVKKDLQKSIQQADKSLTILNTVDDLYNPSMSQLGSRFSLALANFQSGLGIPLSQQEQAELNNFLQASAVASQEFNETLQRMSGAAVTDSESERFKPVLINIGSVDNPFSGDSPAEIQAKLSTQRSVILSSKIRASALLSEDKLITDDMATMYPLSVSVSDEDGNKRTFFIIDEYNAEKFDNPELTDTAFMAMWAETVKTARAKEAAKKD